MTMKFAARAAGIGPALVLPGGAAISSDSHAGHSWSFSAGRRRRRQRGRGQTRCNTLPSAAAPRPRGETCGIRHMVLHLIILFSHSSSLSSLATSRLYIHRCYRRRKQVSSPEVYSWSRKAGVADSSIAWAAVGSCGRLWATLAALGALGGVGG